MSMKLSLVAVLAAVVALGTAGCASDAADDGDTSADDIIRKTSMTSSWSYHGLMPELESPSVTISLKGNTAHVTGLLPTSFTGRLPFYVKTEEAAGGRTRVHLAYPIATVDVRLTVASGLHARNPEPGDYDVCGGTQSAASNPDGSYGGFPFVEYICHHRDHDGRIRSGIAMHGPIDGKNEGGTEYWFLQRGPVSHACNRMLGEHVLELSHMLGFDKGVRHTPVKVIADYDTFDGKPLDVDYPATGWTRPANAEVFPTWQAVIAEPNGTTKLGFPQWACETSRCASMPANAFDPYTGAPVAGSAE